MTHLFYLMRKSALLLIAALLFIAGSSVYGQTGTFTVTQDISYRSGDDYVNERCRLDIREPAEEGSYPVVVWFHGGGLTGGDKYFPGRLLDAQVVLVAVNYRLSPQVKVSEILDDAAAAVAWTFSHAEEYKGNPEQVIVSGHSAGGYITSMIGLDKQWLETYDRDADDILALFPFSGHAITHFTVRKEMGIPGKQPVINEMAPLYHVRPDAPALYLLTGDRELEMLGRYEENAYMYRMMKVNGHEKTYLYEFDGHGHGAMTTPGQHVLLEFIENLNP